MLPGFAQTPSSAGYGFGTSVTGAGLLMLSMPVAMFVAAGILSGRLTSRSPVKARAALRLRKPGFERMRVMDRIGLAAALFDEGEPEQAADAAQQALDDAARVDSTLVASRVNTLLDAARPYRTAAVDEVCTRAKDLVAARPTAVAG